MIINAIVAFVNTKNTLNVDFLWKTPITDGGVL